VTPFNVVFDSRGYELDAESMIPAAELEHTGFQKKDISIAY
jgi:hypothetical protein